jgi:hypothetical protein
MQLSRWTAVLLMCVAASACRDSAGPGVQLYQLTEINGQPLPVTLPGGIDFFERVLSGTLLLDGSGHVVRSIHFRSFDANTNRSLDGDQGRRDDYRIDNGNITVGSLNGCTSSCGTNEVGVFSESMLTLTLDVTPRTQPVYTYRLVTTF